MMVNLIVVEFECQHRDREFFWQLNRKFCSSCALYRGVHCLQTLVSSDRQRVILELEAPDAESVRELLRQQKIVFERVWTAIEKKH